MASAVLDASAVLALLANERGAEQVQKTLGSALMSAVNLAEVLAKLTDRGVPAAEQRMIRMSLDIEVRSFDERSARHDNSPRPVDWRPCLPRACYGGADPRSYYRSCMVEDRPRSGDPHAALNTQRIHAQQDDRGKAA
jgi:hypothetical protein